MVGPVVNSVGIVFGSVVGTLSGQLISPSIRKRLNYVFTCITLGLGISMTAKVDSLAPVVIAIIVGAVLGEALRIESLVMRLAFSSVKLLRRRKPAESAPSDQTFRDQFAVLTVLFCFSVLGVIGSMTEGMTGDPTLLLIKTLLDFLTAMIFAANIGGVVGVLSLPQFASQASIFLLAAAVVPFATPTMLANFSACGGIIMIGTGLRQCSLVEIPILSMLPGLFLVMPISAVFSHFFSI